MRGNKKPSFFRSLRASWRDTVLLFREFRLPLFVFLGILFAGGVSYHILSQSTDSPTQSLSEALYTVLTLIFLQPIQPYPKSWYLQIFYFLMPLLGLSVLAQGLTEFGILFFNRRARNKEWQMAVASTYHKHIILVGLGHLGTRVVTLLRDLDEDTVVIEIAPRPDLKSLLHHLDIPLIEDDATREEVLLAAGVSRAKAIMLLTQNDSLNLEMALKARKINPGIQVIVRIFDDEFADSLQKQFGFQAFSATGLAAPIFAATAAGIDMTPPISIEGKPHTLAKILVSPSSHLIDKTINQIEEQFRVSVVFLQQNGQMVFHPEGSLKVVEGSTLAIFGPPGQIHQIVNENH